MLQLQMLRLDAISDARWAAIIKALRRVVARRGVDRADVDDVIQTSLEKALRRVNTLADGDRLDAWLNRIAANEAIDQLRRRGRQHDHAPLDAAHAIAVEYDPVDHLLTYADCVRPFLRRLYPAHAEALSCKDLDGLSFEELAGELSLSVPGAKSRVQRARRKLAAELASCCAVLRTARTSEENASDCEAECCPDEVHRSFKA